jgi:hypothetical protein
MLHLVALGSGRALVRTIETDRSPVSERTLALMARELLGTAYLFESPSSVPAEVTEVVRSVKKEIPPEPEPAKVEAPPPLPPPPRPWSAWLRVQTAYPLNGGEDAVPVVHLALLGERQVGYGAEFSFGLTGSLAAISRAQTSGAAFYTVGAMAALYRGFPLAQWTLGPIVEGTLNYGVFVYPGNPAVGAWLPTLALGPHLRSERRGASLGFTLAAAWSPQRATLGVTNGPTLYRTPSVELQFAFSVGWQGI